MEATEKGLIKTDLKFGQPRAWREMLKDIAYRKGIGKDLAMGSRWLSKKYGGEDFAIQVKGMEMAAYDPRGCVGHGLSYAVANRGACHLSTIALHAGGLLRHGEPLREARQAHHGQVHGKHLRGA